MSADHVTAPVLARLQLARRPHEAITRWLALLAPLLLIWFVVAALLAHPAPSLSGQGLVLSIAIAGFVIGVLGRNATAARVSVAHVCCVGLLLACATTLLWLQPDGPGAEGVLVGVLCFVRLLPRRASVPVLLVAFLAVEVIGVITSRADLAVLTAIAGFYGMLFLTFRLSESNKQAERLLAELERSRAEHARAAGLAERQRLAREMHDVLAHSLSGLILQLEGARMLAAENPGDPRLPGAINRAHQLGRTGLEEARRAIGMLRDDELPGPERLAGLAAQFEHDRTVPCRLAVSGEPRQLGSEARLAVYRVAQEALTNITRHARPERVELHLTYEPGSTRLTVEDFAEPGSTAPTATDGYGLTGMRERAELLGGTLTTAATSGGFRVELELPA